MFGRILFFGLPILVLLFVPSYWLQLLAISIICAGLFSFLITAIHKKSIRLLPEFPILRLYAHERETIRLLIQNRGLLPLYNLAIKDEISSVHLVGSTTLAITLNGQEQHSLEYTVWNEHRGLYTIGPVQVSSHDPLGLFHWQKTYDCIRKVIVYPRVSTIDLQTINGMIGSISPSRRPEHHDPLEIRGLRPYETGDDPRDIHWKASAKTGTILIRQSRLLQEIPLFVVLNLRQHDFHHKRRELHSERCIEAAAAICVYAGLHKLHFGLFTNGAANPAFIDPSGLLGPNGGGITSDFKDNSIPRMLELLAVVQLSETQKPVYSCLETISFSHHPHILLIGPPLIPEDLQAFLQLQPYMRSLVWWVMDEKVERQGRLGIDTETLPPEMHTFRLTEFSQDIAPIGSSS